MLIQTVAQSKYASNTLIIIIEDDSQDGADHVDSHRATTYFVGPYVKQRAIVSTRYSQPSVLRSIEDIVGTQHVNLNTYYSRPMADVFDVTSSGAWTFTAIASTLLKTTTVLSSLPHDNSVQFAAGPDLKPTHNATYWAAKTRGMDFSAEDRVPASLYNKILWEGIKGTPAPVPHTRFQMIAKTDALFTAQTSPVLSGGTSNNSFLLDLSSLTNWPSTDPFALLTNTGQLKTNLDTANLAASAFPSSFSYYIANSNGTNVTALTVNLTSIAATAPEPASLTLAASALLALGLFAHRRRA